MPDAWGCCWRSGRRRADAASPSLLEATLGPEAGPIFASIRTGEDVRRKKPDPEVYRLVLSDLALDGRCCLCIEDSRNGLVAARAAGMRTVVTPSLYTCHEDFSDADLVIGDLSMPWSSPEFGPLTSLADQPPDVLRLLTRSSPAPFRGCHIVKDG